MNIGSAFVALRMLGCRGPWPTGCGFDAAEDGEATDVSVFIGVVALVLDVVAFALGVYVRSVALCVVVGVLAGVSAYLTFVAGRGRS